jgi:large subunit ribosomal protein L9e
MLGGVTIKEGAKDELVIEGNDIENVSQSAASITDKCRVKDKDVREIGTKCG